MTLIKMISSTNKHLSWEEAGDVVEVRHKVIPNDQPLLVEERRDLFKRPTATFFHATSSQLANKPLLGFGPIPGKKGDHAAAKEVAHQYFGFRDVGVLAKSLKESLKVLGFWGHRKEVRVSSAK